MFNSVYKHLNSYHLTGNNTHTYKSHVDDYINYTYYPLSIAGDECSNCTQLCNFYPSNFNCSCYDGYILGEDGVSCNGMFQYSQTAL